MTNHLFFGFNQPSYCPGRNIDGVIVLHLQSPLKIKKIGVDWEGIEFVSWWQGVSQSENVNSKRTILKESLVIEEHEEPVELQKGTYAYNVVWKLPNNIPGNFEEKLIANGLLNNVFIPEKGIMPKSLGEDKSHIRYFANTYVEIVNEKEGDGQPPIIRLERITHFKVIEQFDPEDLSKPPVEIDNIEKPIFLFGSTIRVRVRIANGGVLFTGQKLFLHILVENKSSRKVGQITITLFQTVKFSVLDGEPQELIRREPVLNAIVENSALGPQGVFDREISIPIPPMIPGSLRAEFISRKYEISVDVDMPLVSTITVKNPITLLEYSPVLKGIIPEVVNINIHPTNDNGNGGDNDSLDDISVESTGSSSD
jgi:hypothetical protein